MSDFYTDVDTIKIIVNQAPSRQKALDRFGRMDGFSISRHLADRIFNEAADRKFKPGAVTAVVEDSMFKQSVSAKYAITAKVIPLPQTQTAQTLTQKDIDELDKLYQDLYTIKRKDPRYKETEKRIDELLTRIDQFLQTDHELSREEIALLRKEVERIEKVNDGLDEMWDRDILDRNIKVLDDIITRLERKPVPAKSVHQLGAPFTSLRSALTSEASPFMQKVEAKYKIWESFKGLLAKIWTKDAFKKAVAALILSVVAFNATVGKGATPDLDHGGKKPIPVHIDQGGGNHIDHLTDKELKEYQSKEPLGQTGHKFMQEMNKVLKDGGIPVWVKASIVKQKGIYQGTISVHSSDDPSDGYVNIIFSGLEGGRSFKSSDLTVESRKADPNGYVKGVAEMIGKQIAKDIGMKYNAPWGTVLDKDDSSAKKAPTHDQDKEQPKTEKVSDQEDWKAEHQKTVTDWKAEHQKKVSDWKAEHQKKIDDWKAEHQMAGR
jgi:hypothetical protein